MDDVFVIAVTFICAFLIVKALNRWKNRKKVKSEYDNARPLPGPWPWPIVGNAPSLSDAIHLSFDELAQKYGPVFGIKLGTVPVVVLNSLDAIKEALVKQKDIFSGRPKFPSNKSVSFGLGVAFNDNDSIGNAWGLRKNRMIHFLHKYATGYKTAISKHIRNEMTFMIDAMEKQCNESGSGYIDPEQVIRVCFGNALCAMCFGKRYHVDNAQFNQLLSMNREFGIVLGAGSRIDVMPWMKVFPYYRKIAKDFEELSLRMENWVLDRVTENIQNYTPGKENNIVDSLIENELHASQKMLDKSSVQDLENIPIMERIDHIVLSAIVEDIFGAGQDTFASSFMFFLHYMIRFPEIQERIRQDIYNVTGADRMPHTSDCSNLPYLEAVYHEVMRHSSLTAVTIPHRTLTNTILQGYKIPKDTMVFVNQYSANHDANLWKNPYDFVPERFLETVDGRYQLNPSMIRNYVIFSAGRRKCPGDEVSKIWLTLAAATILHQCEILPDPENPPTDGMSFGLTLKPRNLKIGVKRLNAISDP